MRHRERQPLNESDLGSFSKATSARLLTEWPEIRASLEMEPACEPDGLSIALDLQSPTGDPTRPLGIWVNKDRSGGPDLSIGFGPWHTHASLERSRSADPIEAILLLLRAIFRDEIVIIEQVGGPYPGHRRVLDLREPDALAEFLTDRWSADRVVMKSWSGRRDREVSLDDLSL
jgi:hypothetical protein